MDVYTRFIYLLIAVILAIVSKKVCYLNQILLVRKSFDLQVCRLQAGSALMKYQTVP